MRSEFDEIIGATCILEAFIKNQEDEDNIMEKKKSNPMQEKMIR